MKPSLGRRVKPDYLKELIQIKYVTLMTVARLYPSNSFQNAI